MPNAVLRAIGAGMNLHRSDVQVNEDPEEAERHSARLTMLTRLQITYAKFALTTSLKRLNASSVAHTNTIARSELGTYEQHGLEQG